jgi:hypothetical protein
MSLEAVSHHYGTYFSELAYPERLAAMRYIAALSRRYPDLAAKATAGPGNEGTVYVYAPVPVEDDQHIEIYEALADRDRYSAGHWCFHRLDAGAEIGRITGDISLLCC